MRSYLLKNAWGVCDGATFTEGKIKEAEWPQSKKSFF